MRQKASVNNPSLKFRGLSKGKTAAESLYVQGQSGFCPLALPALGL